MSSWCRGIRRRAGRVSEVLARGDLGLFLHAFGFALLVPLLLRLPLPRLEALLAPSAAPARGDPALRERTAATVLAMLDAMRPLARRGCLTRGLTLYYFLRRAGVDVSLCFGMGRSGEQPDGFDGHCWLVLDREPYLEARDPRPLYVEMVSFNGAKDARPLTAAPAAPRTPA